MPVGGAFVLVWLTCVIGWVANIVQIGIGLAALESVSAMSGFLLFKIICVVIWPAGAVLGWVGMF